MKTQKSFRRATLASLISLTAVSGLYYTDVVSADEVVDNADTELVDEERVPLLDEDGNPVLDDEGNQVFVEPSGEVVEVEAAEEAPELDVAETEGETFEVEAGDDLVEEVAVQSLDVDDTEDVETS